MFICKYVDFAHITIMKNIRGDKYLLLDMASLQYQRSADLTHFFVTLSDNSPLLTIEVEASVSDPEAVFLALEELLAKTFLKLETGIYPVALYNPNSYQVAINPTPNTLIFSNNEPLILNPLGSIIDLDSGYILHDEERIPAITPQYQSVLANILAQQ